MPKPKVTGLLYAETTYKVRGAMYKVHSTLGSGHKESVYQKALQKEFELQEIPFEREVSLPVIYEGIRVGTYRPDFIVDEKVLIELKAVPFITFQAERQLSYYLRGTSYKLGLLANFGADSLIIKRKIWDKARDSSVKSAQSANNQHHLR